MSGSLNRRQFIQIGGAAAGVGALGSGLVSDWWGMDRPRVGNPETDGDKVVPTFCELCFWKCGVLAHVKDGRVTKITGNPHHPLSRGKLCPRGTGGIGLLYDPDRLKKPMVRVKKRGDDIFEEVSWNTALDEVASGMLKLRDKYGPESLALFSHGYGGSWFKHLLKSYGSANIAAPSYAQCRGPREVAFEITFGQGLGSPEPLDIENTRCLALIGGHLGENMHNTQVQEFARAINRGADLIVVDPRFSTAAGKAKYWLPIKPGTDIALLLAWMNVIITENRYDKEYIEKYASGFDALKAHVADKTPEWAYPHTGIRPDLVRTTARVLAGARPASIVHPGRRTTWYGDDTQRLRGVAILTALLGGWGRKGGYLLPSNMEVPEFPYTKNKYQPKTMVDKPSDTTYPLANEALASGLCDATMFGNFPYNLKGWLVYGSNLIQSLPKPSQTIEAIQKLDFIVSVDVLPAEICGWSDVVLPESTYLERCDDVWSPYYKEPFIAVRQPVVEPMYESKPGWWIAREIAHRIGLEDYFPWVDAEQYSEHRVREAGYSCDTIRKTGVQLGKRVPVCEEEGLALSFDTRSGKIELFSEDLKNLGFHPMPEYVPNDDAPPGMFRLLFGRAPMHTFGRTANNRFLSQTFPENEVWIHPSVARDLPGFEDTPLHTGDRVRLVNQDDVKSLPVRARVTERIRGDCVYMVHGWGHRASRLKYAHNRGASDSELITRYKVDPIMGGTGMNVNFVRIEPVEAAV